MSYSLPTPRSQARQESFDAGMYTTVPFTANPQILPEWLSYTTYVVTEGDIVRTVQSVVNLPLTYYGPSIPLDDSWTYGGLTSPAPGPPASKTTSTAMSMLLETPAASPGPSTTPAETSRPSNSLGLISSIIVGTQGQAASSSLSRWVAPLSSSLSHALPSPPSNSHSPDPSPSASGPVTSTSASGIPIANLGSSELIASILGPSLVVAALLFCCIAGLVLRRWRTQSQQPVPGARRAGQGGWRSVSVTDPDAGPSIPRDEPRTSDMLSTPPLSPRSPFESENLLGTAAKGLPGKQEGHSLLSKMASAGVALGILGSHRKSSAVILEAGERKQREPSAGGADITTALHNSEMVQRSSTPASRNDSSSGIGNAAPPSARRLEWHPFTEHMSPEELFFQAPPHTASTVMTTQSHSRSGSGSASKSGSSVDPKRLSARLGVANSPGQYSIAIPETPMTEPGLSILEEELFTANGSRRARFTSGAERMSFPLPPPPPPPKSPKRESWVSAVESLGVPGSSWIDSAGGVRESGINSVAGSSYHSASSSPLSQSGELTPARGTGQDARPSSMATFGAAGTPTSSRQGYPSPLIDPGTPSKLIQPWMYPSTSPTKPLRSAQTAPLTEGSMLFGPSATRAGTRSSKETSSSADRPAGIRRESYSSYPGQPLLSEEDLQKLVDGDQQPTLSAVQPPGGTPSGAFGEFGQPLRSVSGSTARLMVGAPNLRHSIVASVYSSNEATSPFRSPSTSIHSHPSSNEPDESLGYSAAAVRGKRSLPQLVPASLIGRNHPSPPVPPSTFGSDGKQKRKGLSKYWQE